MANNIEMVRGASETFEVTVVDASYAAYNLGSNEKIVFGVKASPDKDAPLLICKTAEVIGAGLFRVKLAVEDTQDLATGTYFYDVGLDDGTDFFPVIPWAPFEILPNATYRGCTV